MLVARLLVEKLGFEEVGHLAGAGTVVIAVEAEVLFRLLDAALGYVELLTGFHYAVPGVLHTDGEQLGVVGELVLRLLVGDFLAFYGM